VTLLKTHEHCLKGAYDQIESHRSLKYLQRFGKQSSCDFNIAEDDLIHTGHGNSEEWSDSGNVLFQV
jgi:hypothetical protein